MTSRPRFAPVSLLTCGLLLAAAVCSGSSSSSPPPDTTPPTVSSTTPAAASTGVSVDAVVTATFSKLLDPITVNAHTFEVVDSGGHAVAGTVSSSGATATFTPASPLVYLTTYTATLTKGIKDTAGNSLAADDVWRFTSATTPSPLISPAVLARWVADGNVNDTGDDRVVVLDVTSQAAYDAGHIPGAQLLSSAALYQNRQEGPAVDISMVPDGAAMDALVRAAGIDDRTTVVFTTSSILNATRAYWTFRYWGFPKEKLKLLDGLNVGWTAAGNALVTEVPTVAPSTYTVKGNGALRSEVRASLSEMMAVAAGGVANAVILDARSTATTGSYAGVPGSTSAVFGASGDFVAFEGHMNGAQALPYTDLYDAASLQFRTPAELAAAFATVGIDATKTTYVHCRTGVIATLPFFALDAILGWPAVNYDGSWSQWGQLSGDAANGGMLPADSPWRTDVPALSALVVYNHATKPVELLALDGFTCSGTLDTAGASTYAPAGCTFVPPDSSVASGNQIEEADAAYFAP